jgi:deoxyribonuclease-1
MSNRYLTIAALIIVSSYCHSATNETIQSFSKAKKQLEQAVYHDHRETLYCGAKFDDNKKITPPAGFTTTKHKKRANRVEWEHVVPAENFGRTFIEWREGHPECQNKKGKSFKGRNCASKVNTEYRYMQSDLYNLFPAIGAVNAMRSNYNFVARLDKSGSFGSCKMIISERKAVPPESARGRISRTYLYMQSSYNRYKMSKQQNKLMSAWDKMYPVSEWECKRAERIQVIQGNQNKIMAERCT